MIRRPGRVVRSQPDQAPDGAEDYDDGAIGRGDSIRYYMRVLAPEEIREMYQKERL